MLEIRSVKWSELDLWNKAYKSALGFTEENEMLLF